MNKCLRKSVFLLFDSHFFCSLSQPLFLVFFWCVCSHLRWGYMSHLFPLGVTVMEPSSHCVHPKFPFQDACYSKPYLVKNKPQKMRCDVEEKRWSREGEEGGEWSEQMWKSCSMLRLAHLDIHWMWQTVVRTIQKGLETDSQGSKDWVFMPQFNNQHWRVLTLAPGMGQAEMSENVTYTEQTMFSMVPITSYNSRTEPDQLANV